MELKEIIVKICAFILLIFIAIYIKVNCSQRGDD